jgi:hypothetical protein
LSTRSWRSSCTGRGWPSYPSKSASDYIVYAFLALILFWAWLAHIFALLGAHLVRALGLVGDVLRTWSCVSSGYLVLS